MRMVVPTSRDQILSVYYTVRSLTPLVHIQVAEQRFAFEGIDGDAQTFRWVHPADLEASELTFPIDRVVLSLLKNRGLPSY